MRIRRRRSPADERGSLALEYVIAAPLFLIVFALIWCFARVSSLNGRLDTATRDAAREVTLQADLAAADTTARDTVQAELGDGAGGCNRNTVTVVVTATDPRQPGLTITDPALFIPGDTVTVTATCGYSLSDLGLPFSLGQLHTTSQFSSVIDWNRSIP